MKNIFYKFTLKNFIKKMNTENTIKIESLNSSKTPSAIGPYSKATRIEIGDKWMIFTSGALGVDHTTNEFVSDEVTGQTKQALENLKNLLE
jgi:enamine deaminase RidA (YjgF/YER057c/UK114 family)